MLVLALCVVLTSSSVLSVSALGTSSPQTANSPLKGGYPKTLTSPEAQYYGQFGYSVAISGELAVVGAWGESAGGYSEAGHAYIYSTTTWKAIENLTSPNAQGDGWFGSSVAISGNLVIVGAPLESARGYAEAGHAYVYNTATGKLIQNLTSPNAQEGGEFGYSVAVDSNLAVVGAWAETVAGKSQAGHAYVYDPTTGKLIKTLTSPNAQEGGEFGVSAALSGKLTLVGAPDETLDGFYADGGAYVFNAVTGKLVQSLTSPNEQDDGVFGQSVAMGSDLGVVGAPGESVYAGTVYVFNASTWGVQQTLTSPNEQMDGWFGGSVALSGKLVTAGAPGETSGGFYSAGNAYVFNAVTGKLVQTLTSRNPQASGLFGTGVAMSSKFEVVGAPWETAGGYSYAGHAYVFKP